MLSDAKAAAANQLRNLADQAVATLAAVMGDQTASAGDRLKAAALILDRVGLATVAPIGPTDAERIERERLAEEKNRAAMDAFSAGW